MPDDGPDVLLPITEGTHPSLSSWLRRLEKKVLSCSDDWGLSTNAMMQERYERLAEAYPCGVCLVRTPTLTNPACSLGVIWHAV